jgi:hypothetical protein
VLCEIRATQCAYRSQQALVTNSADSPHFKKIRAEIKRCTTRAGYGLRRHVTEAAGVPCMERGTGQLQPPEILRKLNSEFVEDSLTRTSVYESVASILLPQKI